MNNLLIVNKKKQKRGITLAKFYWSISIYLKKEEKEVIDRIIKKNQVYGISVSKTIIDILKDYDLQGLNLKNKETK